MVTQEEVVSALVMSHWVLIRGVLFLNRQGVHINVDCGEAEGLKLTHPGRGSERQTQKQ